MNGNEIRQKYLKFMEERGHVIISSSSLVPENDPTTLFTGSGMQPLLPYLLGETHTKGKRIADSQKCFRAEDIGEVGDNRHTTFFEMLGNWSLGDYFKKDQLTWFFEFLTNELNIDPSKLYVTVFSGDETNNLPKDAESIEIWKELFKEKGIEALDADMGTVNEGGERGMKKGERIFAYKSGTNWWSRAGAPNNMPISEPGGPDSEVFYDFQTEHDTKFGENCHPNCECGKFLEIGNNVFMEYFKTEKGFEKLPAQNVDFGGGLERITAAANNEPDMFKIDLLSGIIQQLEIWTGKRYEQDQFKKSFRIVADHLRAAIFMVADGVLPSNTEQGYILRRLIRRYVLHADRLGFKQSNLYKAVVVVADIYKDVYPRIEKNKANIAESIQKEEEQFRKTLEKGMREFQKLAINNISGHDAFILFTTYGFPYELTGELAAELNLSVNRKEFESEMKKHQETSRAGAKQKFKGGLADHSENVVQYHTVTHLLLAGLRHELGNHVHQAGSNITGERLRFDFLHPEKVSRGVLDKVEEFVNSSIKAGGEVSIETMSKTVAESDPTIEGSFWERYPNEVKIFTIVQSGGTVLSRELCGGPHVKNLKDIKGTFKIIKETSSSAGVRRIKAVLK